jgi:eukaryotic-like serine/threonine-protein kinase
VRADLLAVAAKALGNGLNGLPFAAASTVATIGFASMSLSAGARIGPYEIVAPLGAGGMGEVYRATDSNLKRQVAIKVLPASVAVDADHLARFQREAEVLAVLNHPNIAAIYGLERSSDLTALVMELVEGEDLSQRIARGAMPIDEALPIARQIADALEAAHERGIIHRDLKPANIKVRPDGTVKVLDFGLARAMEPTGGSSVNAMNSPTISIHATQAGIILGTAAYMSPEQARGRVVDERADIWAFGTVLYEMVTGRRAFDADDISATLAFVITKEPDWTALPTTTPAAIRRLLRRCMEKDPKRRVPHIAVARIEIDEALTTPAGDIDSPSVLGAGVRDARARRVLPPVTLAILAAVAGMLVTWIVARPSPTQSPPLTRFAVTLPTAQPLGISFNDRDLALSPDGTRLVYTAGAQSQLMVRPLGQLDALPVAGVANARAPFVSADGRWIGYFDQLEEGLDTGPVVRRGALKKVPITGGPAIVLSAITGASRGASWGADDSILFATSDTSTGLLRVPAGGGEPTVLTMPDRAKGERDHYFPSALPGGRGVLFTIVDESAVRVRRQVAVLDLKSGQRKTLIRSGSQAEYVGSGHLIYADGGTLWAVRFDPEKLELMGDAVPVVEHVMTLAAVNFSVSRLGTLAYAPGSAGGLSRSLVWVNREGKEERIATPARPFVYPRLSPDGSRVAVSIAEQDNDLWTWDFSGQKLTRLTFGQNGHFLVWTPDGRQIIFTSVREVPNLYRRSTDGTGTEERLTNSDRQQRAVAISPDGKRLVFEELTPAGGYDLMLLDLDSPSTSLGAGALRTRPLIQTPFDERNAAISPDGRWIAYDSNDSGRSQVYVRPFPNVADARYQISTDGGRTPVWASSGRELFFVNGATLMTTAVQTTQTFSAGNPTMLFEDQSIVFDGRTIGFGTGRTYDVSRDGQRFLMMKESAGGTQSGSPSSLIVVQNWQEELKQRVPTR